MLLVQGKISAISDLLPVLELVAQNSNRSSSSPRTSDGEALSTLVVNKIRGIFTSVAVKAPAFGDRRKSILQDIAVLTGATVVISEEVGPARSGHVDRSGDRARRVVATKDNTTIVDGGGSHEAVAERVAQIRSEIERADSDWDREKLNERLAKLSGGCVRDQGRRSHRGGTQGAEAPHRGRRVGDPCGHGGRHRGGRGAALVHAASVLDDGLGLSGDERSGVMLVRRSVVEPLRWIAENAGAEGYVVTAKVADLPDREGYKRILRCLRGSGRRRRHRSCEGDQSCAGERCVDRRHAAHHRCARGREARGG